MSIQYQQVAKTFYNQAHKSVFSIKDFSLTIPKGESICLIGPSGCGKTTVVKMINRLVEPDSGHILLDGESILDLDPYRLRKRIGYIIQKGGLFPNMTVADNVAILCRSEGYDKTDILAKTKDLLALVHLPIEQYGHRYPFELSGGQQQRVGVARALSLDPDYIIMDEPFGALDPLTRHDLQTEFLHLKATLNKTFIIVTHDLNEAFRLGDKVALLQRGTLVQVGTEHELKHHPQNEFVKDFIATYED